MADNNIGQENNMEADFEENGMPGEEEYEISEEEERICQICHRELTDCDTGYDICYECRKDQHTKWIRYLDGDGGYIGFLI